MNTTSFKKTGLETLLTPENSALILIDHQPFQFASLNSHDPQAIMNNVVGLAKVAKLYKVPTLLTTVTEERGGYILKQLQDVFRDQKPINRTFINAWEDERIVDWVDRKEEAHHSGSLDGNLPSLPRHPCTRGRLRGLFCQRRFGRCHP